MTSTISIGSPDYPNPLKSIHTPPPTLYYRGDPTFLKSPSIAIVGPRRNSHYGRRLTQEFTAALCQAGYCIISGMAKGIDTIAHETALSNNSPTIAVLASGTDHIFPAANHQLYKNLLSKNLIISEHPDGTPALRHHFPLRNRIIAGLAEATLIIEAPAKSGSLITAEYAFNSDRSVYAIPGNIHTDNAAGVHRLISSQKAQLVHSPEQLIEELQKNTQLQIPLPKPQPIISVSTPLTDPQKKIINILNSAPLTAIEIASHHQIPLAQINSILTDLELNQLITKAPGARYQVI